VTDQTFGFTGWHELAFHAVEQPVAELLFRVRQNFTDRWLRNLQELGGCGDRPAGIDSMEDFDVA